MRIVHVASAFTPTNRFGGPTRVATGLAAELQKRGHDVMLLGAGLDWDVLPTQIDGVPCRLVAGFNPAPPLGWSSVLAPGLQRVVREELGSADVAHVHLARDVVTLTAALAARRYRVPYLVQTHGMVDVAGNLLASAVDWVATAKAIRGAQLALYLTYQEKVTIDKLSAGRTSTVNFPNGVEAAPTDPTTSGVLFLARLHPRKGATAFAEAAAAVSAVHPYMRFTIAGPDEGDGSRVRRTAEASRAADRIDIIGAVPPVEARRLLAGAAVYVLPAEAEPFGMTLIEAMSAARPVVLHASAALAGPIVEAGAGWTFGAGGTHRTLAEAIITALDDAASGNAAGAKAAHLVDRRYSIGHVTDLLENYYEDITKSWRGC